MNDEIGLECSADGSEASGLRRSKSGSVENRADKMVTWTWHLAVFKRARQNRWAAGGFLLPVAYDIQLWLARYQDLFHGDVQQSAKCVKVVDGGQAFALLPFVDCLGLFEAEPVLQVADGEAAVFAEPDDVLTGGHRINHRKQFCHNDSSIRLV